MDLHKHSGLRLLYKRSSLYIIGALILFTCIGILTTIKPAYRLSSEVITEWTTDINSSTFLYLLGIENRAFQQAVPEDHKFLDLSTTLFRIATSLKPNDIRSLLGNELPGFKVFDNHILIAGEGTNYTNLPIESSPPLQEVLKEREAIIEDEESTTEQLETNKEKNTPTTGNKEVVYIYNSHNRESFLPYLPDVKDPDKAYHKEVNISKVSNRLAKSLQANGIGTVVDDTDITKKLHEKGWGFGRSYDASREVVADTLSTNKDIQYAFDLHRDAIKKEKTTKQINGKSYARIMIVVGAEHNSYKKNLDLAAKLHYLLEEKYPGLSRGVFPRKDKGTNGVFNQDLSNNALLFEFGGVENKLDELYRSADALADVFSEMYWDAEKVDTAS
ncbi:spore autolysin SpoIIP [Virgibacillus salarius]|uniref:stage II sporulation protein P n=1 Tax=Virgibacillus salarius TaxID=447199 RepID=UPI0031DAC04C